MAQLVKNPPAMWKTWGSIPGLGRYPGEENGYPLQYSGLENSMDCIVHRVTKSQTRLSDFHFHFSLHTLSMYASLYHTCIMPALCCLPKHLTETRSLNSNYSSKMWTFFFRISIIQMWKLGEWEGEELAQSHTNSGRIRFGGRFLRPYFQQLCWVPSVETIL